MRIAIIGDDAPALAIQTIRMAALRPHMTKLELAVVFDTPSAWDEMLQRIETDAVARRWSTGIDARVEDPMTWLRVRERERFDGVLVGPAWPRGAMPPVEMGRPQSPSRWMPPATRACLWFQVACSLLSPGARAVGAVPDDYGASSDVLLTNFRTFLLQRAAKVSMLVGSSLRMVDIAAPGTVDPPPPVKPKPSTKEPDGQLGLF